MDLVKNNEHTAMAKAFGVKEFGTLLESAMERESKFTTKKSFAPSSLGYTGSCPRYWYYAFNGANFEYETDGPSMANMNAGSQAGERLAGVFEKAGILKEAETPVEHSDPPIFGYMDALVEWKGENVPVEIKTTKNETWQTRVASNSVPGYQMVQLLIYMYVLGYDKGFFLTENKNTHELFILPIRMTEERLKQIEDIFDWMRATKANAESGELPTRPFTKSSLQCKGCPVKKTCWQGKTRGSVNGVDPAPGTITLPILEIPK